MYILFLLLIRADPHTEIPYRDASGKHIESISTKTTVIDEQEYFCPNLFNEEEIEEIPSKCDSKDQNDSNEQIYLVKNETLFNVINSAIQIHISGLKSSIDNIKNDLDNIKDDFGNMKNDIDDLKNTTTDGFRELSSKVDQNFFIQSGIYAKNSSKYSTGIFQIDPPSKEGNCYASGNLVNINNSLFFSTCRHVVMFKDGMCIRNISLIQLYDGPQLKANGLIYIFSDKSTYFDYALIKVEETEELFSRAAIISNESAYLSQIVRGISYRDFNIVYIEGQVVEIDQNHTNVYQTNCGRTHGFSGTGYFDDSGKLKVIHRGSGQFLGEEEIENDEQDEQYSIKFFKKANTPKIDSIQDAFEYCQNADLTKENKKLRCYGKISSSINVHARNPRTMVLDAQLFFDLITNKSKMTLSLQQGQNFTIINNTIVPLEIENITKVNVTDSNSSDFNNTL